MTTVVLVGNSKEPFSRLLDAVARIAPDLPQPVVVQYGNTPFGNPACQCHAFFDRDTLSSLIESSHVVICHAGAGCVIDALRAGRIPVVMPRTRAFGEVIDDHQSEFAAVLLEAQKAVVVHDAIDLAGLTDGVLFVLRAGSTPATVAERAAAEFRSKNLLGIVFNQVKKSDSYGNYEYNYSSEAT